MIDFGMKLIIREYTTKKKKIFFVVSKIVSFFEKKDENKKSNRHCPVVLNSNISYWFFL